MDDVIKNDCNGNGSNYLERAFRELFKEMTIVLRAKGQE